MLSKSRSNVLLSVSVSTRVPATNATLIATATVVSSNRNLRAKMLLRATRSMCLQPRGHRLEGRHLVEDRLCGRGGKAVDDAAVGEEQDAVGVAGRARVVRHHDDGLAEVVRRVAEEPEQLRAGARIEVARRFV